MTTIDKIFTEDAIRVLGGALNRYDNTQDFLALVDQIAGDPDYTIPLSIPIEVDFQFKLGRSKNENPSFDATNARLIYQAIGTMDRANASDPRLWSYLSLVAFRDYVFQRWPGGQNFKTYALDHWLLHSADSRRIVRNGIARLWWVAEYSYDVDLVHPLSAKSSDPHAYTDWLFDQQERVKSLFERTIARSPRLFWPLVENMAANEKTTPNAVIQAIATTVNLRSGCRRLECLSDDELNNFTRDLITETIATMPEKENTGKHALIDD